MYVMYMSANVHTNMYLFIATLDISGFAVVYNNIQSNLLIFLVRLTYRAQNRSESYNDFYLVKNKYSL